MAAPSEHESCPSTVGCEDFSLFQNVLKNMRLTDDRIVHALNTTIPTTSFSGQVNASETCQALYKELVLAHGKRIAVIKNCISEVSAQVEITRKLRAADMNNIETLKQLRKEQTKLRQMQTELNIDEIVKDQSLKVFYERCRSHYIPPKGH